LQLQLRIEASQGALPVSGQVQDHATVLSLLVAQLDLQAVGDLAAEQLQLTGVGSQRRRWLVRRR
jgi:hypothetical protein